MILDRRAGAVPAPALTRDRPSYARLLIVDDDAVFAGSLAASLADEGYDVSLAHDADSARRELDAGERLGSPFDLALCDVNLPGDDGMALLARVRAEHPGVVVVMLTGFGTVESAVRAIRAGASDFLTKPIVVSELTIALDRALQTRRLLSENSRLKRELGTQAAMGSVIGQHPSLVRALDIARRVAETDATVLVSGESGTGKSMVARVLHAHSARAQGPFVEMHCGAIPETLLESELFGHAKGAFTDAHAEKQGKFAAADSGTIFIDEINSASAAMQLKLLRVLQDRRFEPVGSTKTIEVDVRVVLATNQDLEQLVRERRFREDLYYRVNVVRIELPPLRERAGDVPLLVEQFVRKHAERHHRGVVTVNDDAMALLESYPYPGNIRELENAIERAVVLARRPTITPDDLPPTIRSPEQPVASGLNGYQDIDSPSSPWVPMPLARALLGPERRIILKALGASGWNRQQTADQLGINRTTLYKKMKALGIESDGR